MTFISKYRDPEKEIGSACFRYSWMKMEAQHITELDEDKAEVK